MMMQRRVTKARTTCKCIYAANAPLDLPEEGFLSLELPREVVEVEEVQHRGLGGHLVMFGMGGGGNERVYVSRVLGCTRQAYVHKC